MQIKTRYLIITILALTGVLLYYIYQSTIKLPENTLLIAPKSDREVMINQNDLERINENNFLLTFVKKTKKNASANKRNSPVNLYQTDYIYNYIIKNEVVDGSFLTKENTKASKMVVLNKRTAFELFGSYYVYGETVEINNEDMLVLGVVDDLDKDNANIYTSYKFNESDGHGTYIGQIAEGLSNGEIIDRLKQYGIDRNEYEFVDFNIAKDIFISKFKIVIYLVLISALLCIGLKLILNINRNYKYFKNQMENEHIYEYMNKNKKMIFINIIYIIVAIFLTGLAVFTLVMAVENILIITNKKEIFDYIGNDFILANYNFKVADIYSDILLILAIIAVFIADLTLIKFFRNLHL